MALVKFKIQSCKQKVLVQINVTAFFKYVIVAVHTCLNSSAKILPSHCQTTQWQLQIWRGPREMFCLFSGADTHKLDILYEYSRNT